MPMVILTETEILIHDDVAVWALSNTPLCTYTTQRSDVWFNECFVFIIVRVEEEGDGAGERGLNSVENDKHIFVFCLWL